MDLYAKTTEEIFSSILESIGFCIQRRNSHSECEKRDGAWIIDAKFANEQNMIYCDLHYERAAHFLFFGVDYKKRPHNFFTRNIKKILEERQIPYTIRTVNWFTRRNRAVFRGLKL